MRRIACFISFKHIQELLEQGVLEEASGGRITSYLLKEVIEQ